MVARCGFAAEKSHRCDLALYRKHVSQSLSRGLLVEIEEIGHARPADVRDYNVETAHGFDGFGDEILTEALSPTSVLMARKRGCSGVEAWVDGIELSSEMKDSALVASLA